MSLRDIFKDIIPDRTDDHATSQDALARFLLDIEWEIESKPFGEDPANVSPVVAGESIFVDTLPRFLYSEDGEHMAEPDQVLFFLQNEAVGGLPSVARSEEHTFKTGVRISVLSGNIDVAKKEATLLYKFLLQRKVAFTACGLQVRLLRVIDEPSNVGVDDQSMATYQFRVTMDVVREFPQNL